MTDFAEKARQGRLNALAGLGNNGRGNAAMSADGKRLRDISRRDCVIFISRRADRAGYAMPM